MKQRWSVTLCARAVALVVSVYCDVGVCASQSVWVACRMQYVVYFSVCVCVCVCVFVCVDKLTVTKAGDTLSPRI